MRRYIGLTALFLVFCFAGAAMAATAREVVEREVNGVVNTLKSKATVEQKKAAIRRQVTEFFDLETMTKLALSQHWKKMNPEQQKRFVELYRKLLEAVYMERLLSYENEEVKFEDERKLSDTRSEVPTGIIRDNKMIPLHYRLIRENGQWKVYDLVIEGVSLAKNYRSQFNSFLRKDSIEQLMEDLKRKTQSDQ